MYFAKIPGTQISKVNRRRRDEFYVTSSFLEPFKFFEVILPRKRTSICHVSNSVLLSEKTHIWTALGHCFAIFVLVTWFKIILFLWSTAKHIFLINEKGSYFSTLPFLFQQLPLGHPGGITSGSGKRQTTNRQRKMTQPGVITNEFFLFNLLVCPFPSKHYSIVSYKTS